MNSRADRLKHFRDSLGLLQKDVAGELGVTQSHYSSLELGKYHLTDRLARVISKTYNINESWLLYGEGDMLARTDTDLDELYQVALSYGIPDCESAHNLISTLLNMDAKTAQLYDDFFKHFISNMSAQKNSEE